MVTNAIANLEAIGKGFSFKFLGQPANYDINQRLIEYNSQSSHLRAMQVGILNTLLVAIAGVILATILGFILGVLRLSKNWLTNKIAHVYIEYIRNVPVLLHILLVHGLMVHSLPKPKQAITVGDGGFLTNRGLFMPKPLPENLMWVVIALFFAGIVFAFIFRRWAKKVQDATGKIYPVFWISLFAIIVVPAIAYFALGQPVNWDTPELKGFNFKGGMVIRPEFIALWLALSFYTAAFIAEVIRGGLQAVPKGQTEAADAMGLKYGPAMRLIVLPQALKISIPGIVNTFIGLYKDSVLVIVIGLLDPLGIGQASLADAKWQGLSTEVYLFVAVFFFISCFAMARYSLHLENKLHTGHKR
ncbi:UNVERIFIED_CONTAM: hypothetical protein GTU68_059396 [Idotea baltica]|nr:hypothetical protein [Idotea baltica]